MKTAGPLRAPRTGVICQTVDQSGCKIDPNIVIMNIPDTSQCEAELNQLTAEDVPYYPGFLQAIKQVSTADMRSAFQCMTYSYFRITLGEDCDTLEGGGRQAECESACNGRFVSVFAGRRPSINIFGFYSSFAGLFGKPFDFRTYIDLSRYFDYDIPINLPSREDRKFPQGENYGRLLFDNVLTVDRAAGFIVDVFDQFLGCAVSLDAICFLYSLIVSSFTSHLLYTSRLRTILLIV